MEVRDSWFGVSLVVHTVKYAEFQLDTESDLLKVSGIIRTVKTEEANVLVPYLDQYFITYYTIHCLVYFIYNLQSFYLYIFKSKIIFSH